MMKNPVSVIIVSYNDREMMSRCLGALTSQLTCAGDEIIVVDNGSTDGVVDDLRDRADARRNALPSDSPCPLILIENGENAGFPVGCNIGVEAAAPGNDIFLLNNDAVLSEGALERLREALYSAEDVGAAGAVSNNALEQTEPGISRDVPMDEALAYGAGLDLRRRYEYRSRLTGFAVLIKRSAADRLVRDDGYFLDPRFSPGYFEDEDLGVRIALAGYRQILCHDAFIYHKGGTGFASHPEAMERGRQKFIDKWGFDIWAYIGILDEYEDAAAEYASPPLEPLRILEPDCGMGVNLAHLQYLYPGSYAIGIEREPVLAKIAAQLIDVICAEPETALKNALIPGTPESEVLLPESFDIIFAWDAAERSGDPAGFRDSLQKLLKPGGKLI